MRTDKRKKMRNIEFLNSLGSHTWAMGLLGMAHQLCIINLPNAMAYNIEVARKPGMCK